MLGSPSPELKWPERDTGLAFPSMELYFHFPIRLHGVVAKKLRTGIDFYSTEFSQIIHFLASLLNNANASSLERMGEESNSEATRVS
jgi:hypothetical protein